MKKGYHICGFLCLYEGIFDFTTMNQTDTPTRDTNRNTRRDAAPALTATPTATQPAAVDALNDFSADFAEITRRQEDNQRQAERAVRALKERFTAITIATPPGSPVVISRAEWHRIYKCIEAVAGAVSLNAATTAAQTRGVRLLMQIIEGMEAGEA